MIFWVVWALVGIVAWGLMNLWTTGQVAGKGWVLSLIAALIGSWLGDFVLGDWIWVVGGFNIIAGAIGAVILNWLWSLVRGKAA
jgi:uncharacterized membrane protein YeaQ/YmgE (transglycosylase-associated protein family)